ncbi:hypothetical protein EDD63_12617 [Breznakia blatticola]|uniref:Lipoprotein n=1 Tax=Breznakia blatticola TaxID=1754012 RepID=A0A4R7ZF30_9FIRM|nr:hypothetical protein [Breznakia blatticola]TDW16253.1 hypothetical protein EDD63_12617 [Breznakia blatticola]
MNQIGKKASIFLLLILVLFGCRSDLPSFEESLDEFVEGSETLVRVEEILDYKEFEDALIGIALISNENEDEILYLSGLIVDEDTGLTVESHGETKPIYIHNESEIMVYPSKDKQYESDPKSNYTEFKSSKVKYYTGIVEGNQKLKYNDKKIYTKKVDLEYKGKPETITFWIVKISSDESFNIDKLT